MVFWEAEGQHNAALRIWSFYFRTARNLELCDRAEVIEATLPIDFTG